MVDCDLQMPEEGDMDGTVREEDAADVAARKRAAAKAREEAELRQRSQVCCSPLLCMLVRPAWALSKMDEAVRLKAITALSGALQRSEKYGNPSTPFAMCAVSGNVPGR